MDIRVLNYFLAIAREENITKAASLLHVTQPTLSRQLMQLEEELGVKLFNRGKYNVTLSEEGLLFRRRAQELVDLAEKAKVELTQSEEDLAGEISIGCNESQSVNTLADMINGFRGKYPKVTFVIKSGNNIELREWLEKGIIDAGLFVEPMDTTNYNFLRLEQKDLWGILVSDNGKFAASDSVTAKELAGIPMITILDESIHSELTSWSGKYAAKMNPVAHYNLISNAAALVKGTENVVVCAEPVCKYNGVKFIPFSPGLTMGSFVAWKRITSQSKLETAFLQYIRSELKMAEEQKYKK